MSPDGHIYFPAPIYKWDFSTNPGSASFLIHELTHVYQYQLGTSVRFWGIVNRNYHYGNLGENRKALNRYSIEQQASIVADYYRVTHGLKPIHGGGVAAMFELVIPFIRAKVA